MQETIKSKLVAEKHRNKETESIAKIEMQRNSREQPSSPFLVASVAAAGAQHS